MKKFLLSAFAVCTVLAACAQGPRPGFEEKTVYKGDDLEIRDRKSVV